MKPFEFLIYTAFAAALIVIVWLFEATPEGGADWDAFLRTHNCQSVAEAEGGNSPGWLCDDGKVHYRWRQQR